MTDDNTEDHEDELDGAIDSGFEESELSTHETLRNDQPDMTEPVAGGLAFDLVTRQVLFVRRVVADDLAEYYEAEEAMLS